MKTHPITSRLYDTVMRPVERLGFARQRARLLSDARGRVLEVGFGTGLNLAHYPRIDSLTAVEPDEIMRRRGEARIVRTQPTFPVDLVDADAEALPFPDGSFDTVAATLVLCTVIDPVRALGEARRVLGGDGRLLLFEHVRSTNALVSRVQRTCTPAWSRVAGGCHLDRPTMELLTAAGFDIDDLWRSQAGRGMLVRVRAHPA